MLDELRVTRAPLVCALLGALLAAGCGSASQSITAPSTSKCAVAATADTASFPHAGGSGQISVNTNRECQWTASSPNGWIQLSGTTSGQGEARVSFAVAANGDPAVRQGAISVGDQQVAITQAAAPCQFAVDPIHANVPAAGGRGVVMVTASSAFCAWTARSEVSWLAILEGAQGTGNGQVVYDAQPTSGPPRNGSLTIAGQHVSVAQGDGCATSIGPAAHTIGAEGGAVVVIVTAGEGCGWAASSPVPWATITSGASGSGSGEVRLSVAANAGPERSGTLTIAGHAFTITQASGCNVSITPTSQAFAAAGGSGSITVAAGPGCTWSASSAAAWITVTSGAGGSGPGEVRFAVAANTGPERSGTVSVAGRSFTVTQASGCTVSIAPASQGFGAGGGSGTVNVTVGAGCPWTASASEAWVQITAGASGVGSGTVTFAVAPHDGPARQASLIVGGQEFTIQQESGCAFTLSAPGIVLEASGGGGTVTVQTAAGCSWTASVAESDREWIQISSGHEGVGAGPVDFVVLPNGGPERFGTITAGGQPFSVRQTGGPE
jgi:hypothetical protein